MNKNSLTPRTELAAQNCVGIPWPLAARKMFESSEQIETDLSGVIIKLTLDNISLRAEVKRLKTELQTINYQIAAALV